MYALYYVGGFPVYEPISETGIPIYIGRSAQSATRFGMESSDGQNKKLFERLREHARSIRQAENLRTEDFQVRFLVTEDIWIPLGEYTLLRAYHPVLWNTVVDGFGSHGQGGGRDAGERSKWDTLHPGRTGPLRLRPHHLGADEIAKKAREALAARARGESVDVPVVEG